MSTTATASPSTARPARPAPTSLSQDDCPTEIIPVVAPIPTRRSILHATSAASAASQPERSPFADWRDAAPTELLPAVSPDTGLPTPPRRELAASTSSTGRHSRRPRVSTLAKPTGSRKQLADASTGTKGLRRRTPARHLRAALAGILIAAAILTGLQLFAAQGISSAKQAALEQARSGQTSTSAVPMSGQSTHSGQGAHSPMSGQSPAQPEWVTEHTGAAYDRTNPAASPLDLPRCTASPDTPLPCLATISPSQTRAVVLEEDASLTALVLR